jgi:DNA-binding CsgD family transcriptional regulator
MCLFCETKQDMLEAAGAYFAAARDGAEHCIWIVSRPLTVDEAVTALARLVPGFAERHRAGRFVVAAARDWYYENGRFSWEKAVARWHKCIDDAVARGLDGVRACGNPLWRTVEGWRDIVAYEHALDSAIERRRIVMLCTYTMASSRSEDVLDVARSHQAVIARRSGEWQFLQVPGTDHARREIRLLNGDLAVLPERIVRDGALTERERVVLAQLAKGASSKQVARLLGISPRTVDFHRANMMRKLGARNTAELVGKVLAKD